ncbi:hypothetical protein C8Q76DRAFT_641643 [Earliella scabrosa]|nr:hypothetical protein C8Q76DRAFT_641643 [Earliella scabrosa]
MKIVSKSHHGPGRAGIVARDAPFHVFLVAQIGGPQYGAFSYRSVGAFHHRNCSGLHALRALSRFFSLLEQKENAALVRADLRLYDAAHRYHRQEDLTCLPHLDVPCPYTFSLLAIAWTTDLQFRNDYYVSGTSLDHGLMDVRSGCWTAAERKGNKSGICVIDISDLARPGYCFMTEKGGQLLSAYGYMRACAKRTIPWLFDGSDPRTFHEDQVNVVQDIFRILLRLSGAPLLTADVFREAWPEEPLPSGGPPPQKAWHADDYKMPQLPLHRAAAIWFSLHDGTPEYDRVLFGLLHMEVGSIDDTAAFVLFFTTIQDLHTCHEDLPFIVEMLRDSEPFDHVVVDVPPEIPPIWPEYTLEAEKLCNWIIPEQHAQRVYAQLNRVAPMSAPDGYKVLYRLGAPKHLLPVFRDRFSLVVLKNDRDTLLSDRHADFIARMLSKIGANTDFLDLSFYQLTAEQAIMIANRIGHVTALSLSWNFFITADDIPTILAAIPTLRRLHVVHCANLVLSRYAQLLVEYPSAFRTVEAITTEDALSMSPSLIMSSFVVTLQTDLQLVSTLRRDPAITLSFFTPAQIVRALIQMLDLAFKEHGLTTVDQDAIYDNDELFKGWERHWTGSMRYLGAGADMFSWSAYMVMHAIFACGSRKSRTPWQSRPVVSIPLQDAYWGLDSGHDEWEFRLQWDAGIRFKFMYPKSSEGQLIGEEEAAQGKWGFIRHQGRPSRRRRPSPRSAEDTESSTTSGSIVESDIDRSPFVSAPGRVHDLRGFLRCMIDEGRPMPEPVIVEILEEILETRNPASRELVCQLFSQDDMRSETRTPASWKQLSNVHASARQFPLYCGRSEPVE